MVTPEFLQDSIQVTLRSSGGGYSRSGQPTCAHNPSQALSVLVNSGVSAPSCHRLLRVNSNEVPASSQVQQESWVSAEPLRPDGNSTQGMGKVEGVGGCDYSEWSGFLLALQLTSCVTSGKLLTLSGL